MFSRRKQLSSSRKYTREFFQTLLTDLRSAGFTQSEVKLPFNQTGVEESTISPEEFLKRERNYPALILVAREPKREETLKILFVNRSAKVTFIDDTFPSAESGPPALYFQSPDPGRTHSVFEFFNDYLNRPSLGRRRLLWFADFAAIIVLIGEALTFVNSKQGLFMTRWDQPAYLDIIVTVLAIILIYRFFAEPKGLWIKPRRDTRLIQFANMAIRGELSDNPLVSLIITILGTVLASLILKLVGVF